MRLPGRLHITWESANTLRIETDAGTQTRLLHFGGAEPQSGEPTWQGHSVAPWESAGGVRGMRGRGGPPPGGDLKVVATRMRPGYLQKNGVPYSANAIMTEYFNRASEDNGDTWLILTTIVEDPQYLNGRFLRSTHFKRLLDGSGWNPMPCRSA